MFRYVLRVETRDEKDHYSPNAASHHSFLRLYAFTTQFVLLLREVYIEAFNLSSKCTKPNDTRASERSTRQDIASLLNVLADSSVTRWPEILGKFHFFLIFLFQVHYVSDHWEAFKLAQGDQLDPSMLLRLQVEYDNFFLRAARYWKFNYFYISMLAFVGASFPPKNLAHGNTWLISPLRPFPHECSGGFFTHCILTTMRGALGTLGDRYSIELINSTQILNSHWLNSFLVL